MRVCQSGTPSSSPRTTEIVVIVSIPSQQQIGGSPGGSSSEHHCDPHPEETPTSTLPPMEGCNQTPALRPGQERNGGRAAQDTYTILNHEPVKSMTYRVITIARQISNNGRPTSARHTQTGTGNSGGSRYRARSRAAIGIDVGLLFLQSKKQMSSKSLKVFVLPNDVRSSPCPTLALTRKGRHQP